MFLFDLLALLGLLSTDVGLLYTNNITNMKFLW